MYRSGSLQQYAAIFIPVKETWQQLNHFPNSYLFWIIFK